MPRVATKKPSARLGAGTLSETELDLLQNYVEILEQQRIRLTKQLDAEQYERMKLIFERLGGVYVPGRKQFTFNLDPTPLLAQTIALRQLPKANPLDFYSSPPQVVDALLDVVAFGPTMDVLLAVYENTGRPIRILEPEAGLGHLADALCTRYPMATVDVCEIDPYRRAVLASKGYTIVADDFLQYSPPEDCRYDLILMNPPFTINGDTTVCIKHILHARDLLVEDEYSRLVSVVPAQIATAARYHDFYIHVLQYGAYEPLPQGSFVDAGTRCETGVITLETHKNHFYACWDTPAEGYPNLRLKTAWNYISTEVPLRQAHQRLLREMVEGKLPVYTAGVCSEQAQEAIDAFCQYVTRHVLASYPVYLPFTAEDVRFMQRSLLEDYYDARLDYSESKRIEWERTQQQQQDSLQERIGRIEARIQQYRQQLTQQEQQLASAQDELVHLDQARQHVPIFAPAPELIAPASCQQDTPEPVQKQPAAPAPRLKALSPTSTQNTYHQLTFFFPPIP